MRQSLRNFSRVFLSPVKTEGFHACDSALVLFICIGFQLRAGARFRFRLNGLCWEAVTPSSSDISS